MKILAKRKTAKPPIIDAKGKEIWDGKPAWLTLTEGSQEIIEYMFAAMKKHVDKDEWLLKMVP